MTKNSIGERLREARIKADISQSEAAKLLHCHRSTLAKKESGDRPVYASELIAFAKLYRVPVEYFIRREGALAAHSCKP